MATATIQKQIRLSSYTKQAMEKDKGRGLGKVINDVLKQYVEGSKELPPNENRAVVRVNVPLDQEVAEQFEKLAKENGYSFDLAVRLALTEELNNKRDTPKESDINHAFSRNENQNPT